MAWSDTGCCLVSIVGTRKKKQKNIWNFTWYKGVDNFVKVVVVVGGKGERGLQISTLKHNGQTASSNVDKTNLLNNSFSSYFNQENP